MDSTDRTLWIERDDQRSIHCVMRSCCAGAELQILVTDAPGHDVRIVLREMYPTKSDLYERARLLASHYRDEHSVTR